MEKQFAKAIADALLGNLRTERVEVSVDTIDLEEGKTIEDVMRTKGYTPVGEKCEGCGVHHEWKATNGDTGFITGVKHDEATKTDEAPKRDEGHLARQVKALTSLDKRIKEVEEALDLLKELRSSIAQPLEGRSPLDMLAEVSMAMQAKELLSGGL